VEKPGERPAAQADDQHAPRLDVVVDTLETITDSKDSRTKVARMKEDTGKRLMKMINYYDQKRAALKEELRNPRLRLTTKEKQKMIAAFDVRIQKRPQQIMALNRWMPSHEDHERYKATGGGWYGTDYERNAEYEQNRRMTSHSNTQLAVATDPAQRKTLGEELAKTDAMIAERRQQKLETLKPSGTPARTVALKEATDMDKAIQGAINELSRKFTTLFQRYNTLLNELSVLHTTEATLAATLPRIKLLEKLH
jgi:uncharacterized protein YkwD